MNTKKVYILIYVIGMYFFAQKIYAQQLFFKYNPHDSIKYRNVVKYSKNYQNNNNIDFLGIKYSKENIFYNSIHQKYYDIYQNKFIKILYSPIQVQINNNSLSIMNKIYQREKYLFFSQIGIHNMHNENIFHIGLGERTVHKDKYITGYHILYDTKYFNDNYHNLNIGAELFHNNFQININKYVNTIKQQLSQVCKNKNNILNHGYYVTIQSWMSHFPYLLGKIKLQKTSHKNMCSILNHLNIETNKKFFTWIIGITYQPIPLFCLNIDRIFEKNIKITKIINVSINYHTNIPFKQQLKKIDNNNRNINSVLYNFIDSMNVKKLINLYKTKQKTLFNEKQLQIQECHNESQQETINLYLPMKNYDSIKIFLNKKSDSFNKKNFFYINKLFIDDDYTCVEIIFNNMLQKNTYDAHYTSNNHNHINNDHQLHNNIINECAYDYYNADINHDNNKYHDESIEIQKQQNTKKETHNNISKDNNNLNPSIPIPPPLPIDNKEIPIITNIDKSSSQLSDIMNIISNIDIDNTNKQIKQIQKINTLDSCIDQIQQNIVYHKTNKFANLGNIEHLEKLKNIEENCQKTKSKDNKITSMILSKIIDRKYSLTYSDSDSDTSSDNDSIKNNF